MKKSIIGIFALLAATSRFAFADDTATVAKAVVEEMRGLDMRLGNPFYDDLSPNLKEQHKRDILNELRSIGPDAIPALIQALNDPEGQMRSNADLVFVILGGGYDDKPKMDITKAFPALLKSTSDSNSNARGWAAQAIGEMGPCATNAIPVFTRMLNDPDVGPRNSACIAGRYWAGGQTRIARAAKRVE
jgi:HEAT repeat protein